MKAHTLEEIEVIAEKNIFSINTSLQTIRDLPHYLAPADLAQKVKPILTELSKYQKRLRKALKKAKQSKDQDFTMVWRIEKQIRTYLEKYEHLGLRSLTQKEFEEVYQYLDETEKAFAEKMPFWKEFLMDSMSQNLLEQAVDCARHPQTNPFRKQSDASLLFPDGQKIMRWKWVKAAIKFVAGSQKKRLLELRTMFDNVVKSPAPEEFDNWLTAIEAATPRKDDPYEDLRESACWLTDGLHFAGLWASQPFGPSFWQKQSLRKAIAIAVEIISVLSIISISVFVNPISWLGRLSGFIAMPFIGYLPYIAYFSYRVRELNGASPSSKNKTLSFWIYYIVLWMLMLIPYTVHRFLPQRIYRFLAGWKKRKRLKQALTTYIKTLQHEVDGNTIEEEGDILDILKLPHLLFTLRRRFEIVPLTVLSEISGNEKYIVLDLQEANIRSCQAWLASTCELGNLQDKFDQRQSG